MKEHNYNWSYLLSISLISAMGGLLFGYDWVVIGGASRSTRTPAHHPGWDDISHLREQARAVGAKVYMKTNLLGDETRLREYPR